MDKFSQLYDQYALYKGKENENDLGFTTNLLQYDITEDYFLRVSKAVELLLRFYEAKLTNTTIRNTVAYRVNLSAVDSATLSLIDLVPYLSECSEQLGSRYSLYLPAILGKRNRIRKSYTGVFSTTFVKRLLRSMGKYLPRRGMAQRNCIAQ